MTTPLSMEFNMHDLEKTVSHWFLKDFDVVEKVAETPEWKNDRKMIARVTVNGIELPFAALDKFLYALMEREVESLAKRYADQDAEIQRRVKEHLKAKAEPILDMMDRLESTLRDADSLLKPYWDKD